MQKLRALAQDVESIFAEMAEAFIGYQHRRQLFCREGCGQCCQQQDVHASVLEMLPLALHFYDTGQAEKVLGQLASHEGQRCFFNKHLSEDGLNGQCSIYSYRGSVCRMFGAAGYADKYGDTGLSTCLPVKEGHPQAYNAAIIAISEDPPPVMRHWKNHVANIDYELGSEDLPLVEAVKRALNKVLMTAQYSMPDRPSVE